MAIRAFPDWRAPRNQCVVAVETRPAKVTEIVCPVGVLTWTRSHNGRDARIRTETALLPKQVACQFAHIPKVPSAGFEPAITGMRTRRPGPLDDDGKLVSQAGFEPAISGLKARRLHHSPTATRKAERQEPPSAPSPVMNQGRYAGLTLSDGALRVRRQSCWLPRRESNSRRAGCRPAALPLSYGATKNLASVPGLPEQRRPAESNSRPTRSPGAPWGSVPQSRDRSKNVVVGEGLEPSTCRSSSGCSAIELPDYELAQQAGFEPA